MCFCQMGCKGSARTFFIQTKPFCKGAHPAGYPRKALDASVVLPRNKSNKNTPSPYGNLWNICRTSVPPRFISRYLL